MMRILPFLPLLLGSTFWDGTAASGLNGMLNHNSSWADVDGDGDPDLYIGYQLWLNDGGTFTSETVPFYGMGIWGDFDNDGLLELFTFNGDATLYTRDGDGSWNEVSGAFPPSGIVDSRGASLGDFDGDGLLDVYVGAYESNGYELDVLYLADGALSFARVWDEGNNTVVSAPYAAYSKPGRGVTSCDFDEDNDLDIYVSNYRLEQNYLWLNDGSGQLTEVAANYGTEGIDDGWVYGYGHTIGSAWGDLDNDGHFDLFVGNFSHPYYYQDAPMFLRNQGPVAGYQFEDRSTTAGLAWQESYATPSLADYDNDGDLDLYFTTVYSGDYPVLYRNDGDWRFTDVTQEAGLAGIASTYQAAWADVDLDGDLDLASGGLLFLNEGNDNHWLLLRLEGNGETDNTAAIGAQVRIAIGDEILTRQVESGAGEFNSNDLTLHFGLGAHSAPLTVEVTWPSGKVDTIADVAVDQLAWITQCIDRDGDGFDSTECGGADCNDDDGTIHPDAEEVYYDGIDSNCDEVSDFDADGDGFEQAEDCDDADASIHPDAEETWYDGIDSNCDEAGDFDADGDGSALDTDCDDEDSTIHPGAEEIWYDGIDSNCDGWHDLDADGDGQASADHGGVDCDDTDPHIHAGAFDIPGDDIDQNCDGIIASGPPLNTGPADCGGCRAGGGPVGVLPLFIALGAIRRRYR